MPALFTHRTGLCSWFVLIRLWARGISSRAENERRCLSSLGIGGSADLRQALRTSQLRRLRFELGLRCLPVLMWLHPAEHRHPVQETKNKGLSRIGPARESYLQPAAVAAAKQPAASDERDALGLASTRIRPNPQASPRHQTPARQMPAESPSSSQPSVCSGC